METTEPAQNQETQINRYNKILAEVSASARVWMKSKGLVCSFKTLTYARLGRDAGRQAYPILCSNVKASYTRVLLAFVAELSINVAKTIANPDQRRHAEMRATMLWSISTALQIWDKGSYPWLTEQQAQTSYKHCRRYLMLKQYMTTTAHEQNTRLWKARPKGHYFDHLVHQTRMTKRNPRSVCNFINEDLMGKIATVVKRCAVKTYIHRWAQRFAIKKACRWLRIRKAGTKQ